MNIVITFLKTAGSNIAESDPEGLHAIVTMAWKANMKKAHIRSKLLKRCKNVRTSTKFVLDILRLLTE